MPIKDFPQLIERAREYPPARVAVAAAEDKEVQEGIKLAKEEGLIIPYLVGREDQVRAQAATIGLSLDDCVLVEAPDAVASARKAVELVSSGEADVVMKGMVSTSVFLKAVLNPDYGLRTGKLLSHVAAFDLPHFPRLLFMTDGGVNIAPDLMQKMQILQNSIDAVKALGYDQPRVALLAAVEVVNPQMPATVDAASLAKMAERGQIGGAIVDGPLALDNAVDVKAARQKGIKSPVAGEADILLVPDIEAGNVLGKSLSFLAGGTMAGIVMGSRAPVVLPSRADSAYSKFCSLVFASLVHHGSRAR
ncbi:MAG TPA: bifunctional enoyl-CoA hydratase/phosphate acetyltransferase [Firmicutes bacterium]|nr:bifunctional enoyl-CoA hydratase/phosphate acetyltransferase [Bacillota bacterium]